MTDVSERRCAVIFNPVKVSDGFRDATSARLAAARWTDPIWLSTTEDDPGRSMAASAVEQQVDLVVAAGGDGTVRIVADGLANTGIPMGIVPSGTANLLARNLGIPMAEADAIDVVLSGRTRTIDLIKLTIDGGEPEHFAVMAGMGIDAMTMDETSADLKDKIGTAAYVVAAARALGRLPVPMSIKVDDHRTHRRRAMICVVGNVGGLPGNITLIPGAEPDDGLFDVSCRLTPPVHPVGQGVHPADHPPLQRPGPGRPVAGAAGGGSSGRTGQLPARRGCGRPAASAGGRGATGGALGPGPHLGRNHSDHPSRRYPP